MEMKSQKKVQYQPDYRTAIMRKREGERDYSIYLTFVMLLA